MGLRLEELPPCEGFTGPSCPLFPRALACHPALLPASVLLPQPLALPSEGLCTPGAIPLTPGAGAGPVPTALSGVTGWGRMPHGHTALFLVAGFPAEGRDMW